MIIDKYGLEVELVDIPRNIGLPKNCAWSREEKTLVNSDGSWCNPSANCDSYILGGEINTLPTETIVEQVEIFDSIISHFPMAKVNYRCNLHIHVSFKEVSDKLNMYKGLSKYFYENYRYILGSTMGEVEKRSGMTTGFYGKYKEKNIPAHVAYWLQNSESENEFYDAFFRKKDGLVNKRVPFRRAYVNLHSLSTHGTIEFRNFWATLDSKLVESSIRAVDACIRDLFAGRIPDWGKYDYPKELPYDDYLEKQFNKTKNGN